MRYCTRQKMLCFRNHHCTASISLECTNEASEVWSGILEVILLILMKVHACVCMYGLLHYWKKPSVTKKPSTTEKAIHFIKEVFQFVVKQVQMYVHSICTPWYSKCGVSSKLTGLSQSCLYISFGNWEYTYISLLIEEVIELVRRAIMWDKEGLHQRKGEKGKEIFLQNK